MLDTCDVFSLASQLRYSSTPIDDHEPAMLEKLSCCTSSRCFQAIDNLPLIFLRIVTAISIYVWANDFLSEDKYRLLFLTPRFLFKYPHLEWIKLWPSIGASDGIYWHFIVTKIAAICLGIGFLTRVSAITASFGIAYILLVEYHIYVNHYYLLACVSAMLAFLPAGTRLSVDAAIGLQQNRFTMARWQLALMRFQLGIPYVFGALAKLNGDWLKGQPARFIVQNNGHIPGIGGWDQWSPGMQEFFTNALAYGGFLYDLLIVPMLLYRPTRWLAVALSLVFHLTNAATLTIGIFPWFMLATMVIFFPPEFIAKRWQIILGRGEERSSETPAGTYEPSTRRLHRVGLAAAVGYVIIQLLLPLRPALYAGDANWNQRGHRFAWRMMLQAKDGLLHFRVNDPATGDYLMVPSTTVVTAYQSSHADHHPLMIRRIADELVIAAKELGISNPSVHALALVSLNGRQPTLMIDPSVDLASLPADAPMSDWFIDDPGEFRDPPWLVPKSQWWQSVELPEPFKSLQGRTPQELEEFLRTLEAQREQDADKLKSQPSSKP
ncbi:HTTM domain-containing protein [Rubripirellula amarantea]|nr:HTTM domain-containing protein [Rubripirellula amarantea]